MSRIASTLALTSILCCFYLITTDARARTERHIRQALPEYYLDLLIITDYSVWQAWYNRTNTVQDVDSETRKKEALRNIRQYFTLVIKEVTDHYPSQQLGFRVQFNPVGFYIVQTQSSSPSWTQEGANGLVNASQTHRNVQRWLQSTQTPLPSYDHALLFTGENLDTADGGATTGWGSIGSVCKAGVSPYLSVSVVEDKGAFQSVFTTMHELGHSLNATHDGTSNACQSSDRYVMASGANSITDANRRNPWFFSSCSIAEIRGYVRNILNNAQSTACLRTSLDQVDVPDVTGVVPGQLLDADTQCRRLYGPQSAFSYLGNLSNICELLSCRDPNDPRGSQYWIHLPATGTTCGSGRWCEAGRCVVSSGAPASVPSCYRDQIRLINNRSCAEMPAVERNLCYDPDVYTQCCQSCNNADTGVQGCPYGDRKRGCTSALCNNIRWDGSLADYDCCDTCSFSMSTWTCTDDAQYGGVPCEQAVGLGGVQHCYDWSVAYHCCATCERLRDTTRGRGCEYGDRWLSGCRTPSANDTNPDCDTANCCDTCRAKATDSASCSSSPLVLLFSVLVLHLTQATGFIS